MSGAPQIHISGTINQTASTRVNDSGFCTGDQIGLFGVNYTDDNTLAGELLNEGNQVDNARYTFNAEEWSWSSTGGVYYKDAKTNIDLYGYYPYAANVESVSAYLFEVAQDQSGANTVDGYALSDFLWGKAENIAPSENKVKIKFNHRLASANVILAEGNSSGIGSNVMFAYKAVDHFLSYRRTAEKLPVDMSAREEHFVEHARSGKVCEEHTDSYRQKQKRLKFFNDRKIAKQASDEYHHKILPSSCGKKLIKARLLKKINYTV